jgi:hypothetical protein
MSVTVAMEQLICDWIASLGWDTRAELGYPLSPGPEIHDNPDRIVFITTTGGPGYLTEEPTADATTFQARVRGPSDDVLAASLAAQKLDALILAAQFPAAVDGAVVVHAHRLGGQPAPLPLDPGDRRFEFTCNYVFVTGV